MDCLSKKKKEQELSDKRKDIPIVEHELTTDEVLAKHNVTLEKGLSSAQVQELRAKHGYNRLTPADVIPTWLLFLNQFTNFFSVLLIVGGILCFIAYGLDTSDPSNLYLGIVLEVVTLVTGTFSFYQEAKSNAIMQGFKNMVPKLCKVLRDGAMAVLDASELVPGDVVEFQEGDQVPADVRVVSAYNLKVDNSSLTGESEPQERNAEIVDPANSEHGHGGFGTTGTTDNEKTVVHVRQPGKAVTPAIEATNLMFFSTIVVSGHGQGIVVGTGDNTFMGQIAGLTSESGGGDTKPPLIKEINHFIKWVSIVAIVLGLVFLGIGIGLEVQTVVQALVYCISVIVATVPEGLLCTLTVALSLTAKRMHARNMLVKNLQGVETLGCTTVIASDKTGTLTQNRMTVQHCWYDDQLYDVPAPRNGPEYETMMADKAERGFHGWTKYDPTNPSFRMLVRVATLCNNSEFVLADPNDPGAPLLDLPAKWKNADFNLLDLQCTGDASESGLVKCVQAINDVKEARSKNPKLFEIKFNSTNKWALSVNKDTEAPAGTPPTLYLKGAPERVWARCTHILVNGKEQPITQEWADKFNKAYEGLGSLGERVLGFAYRRLDGFADDFAFAELPSPNFPTDGLVFAGLMSLMDPPRRGVPEAVAICKKASIRVFMVTGDHPITAKAIAHEIGIIDDEHIKAGKAIVVSGDDLRALMDIEDPDMQTAAWDKILAHEQIVFARVTPAHKLIIVENNQRHHHIVTVTGDGVNDAPALKRANNGVSMGIAGKDVSKEAADMILMDDNFASIVNGVEEGRLIFDNLKKSIMYTLTSKPPELIPFIVWVAAGFPLGLSTILILAIDLGTDMLPAIGLAYEVKETAIMSRPPRRVGKDNLVDGPLIIFTYLHFGVIQAMAGFFAFVVALNDYGYNPSTLMGLGLGWGLYPMLCSQGADGKADQCGYGCGRPQNQPTQIAALQAAYPNAGITSQPYCMDGCFAPQPTTPYDPFIEFAGTSGFRGFAAGIDAACGRTCDWYRSLSTAQKNSWLAASLIPDHPERLILTRQDVTAFDAFCAPSVPGASLFGFPGRGAADKFKRAQSPAGTFYWWNGAVQNTPFLASQLDVLKEAQCAYFVTVVLCKAMTVIVSKTRLLSIFQHGILNNRFVLVAIACQICLALLISYVPPLNTVFGTQPLYGAHWALFVPWVLFIFVYDEGRKFFVRRMSPDNVRRKALYW